MSKLKKIYAEIDNEEKYGILNDANRELLSSLGLLEKVVSTLDELGSSSKYDIDKLNDIYRYLEDLYVEIEKDKDELEF